MPNRREVGTRKEEEAARFLEENGYRILVRNYRTKHGEIDLITEERGVLCFVEVKYRSTFSAGSPGEGITPQKRARIRSCARVYLYENGLPEETPCRFDAVLMAGQDITLLRDAF